MSEAILLEEPPKADFREFYGQDPSQFVDLFLPGNKAAKGSLPIVFFIHGGFWKTQYDLSHAGHLCRAFAENLGIAVINVEYRRIGSSGGGWPFTFQDVGAAADFLPNVSEKYSLDYSRVVAMGHSAGGHLALWVAMRSRIQGRESVLFSKNERPFEFKVSICLAGVVNLKEAFRLNLSNGIVKDLIGGTPEEFPKRYAEASPFELLSIIPEGIPPMVLIHGVEDNIVPFCLSKEFVEKARYLGLESARLVELEKTAHFELIDPKTKQFQIVESEIANGKLG